MSPVLEEADIEDAKVYACTEIGTRSALGHHPGPGPDPDILRRCHITGSTRQYQAEPPAMICTVIASVTLSKSPSRNA